MGYCTQTDLETRITAAKVTELSKPEGVAVVVPSVIASAGADIDLHETSAWPDASKKECAIALAVEALFSRHGTGKVPRSHADRAAIWRERLAAAGQKGSIRGTWSTIAYDPLLGESEDELNRLKNGS